MAPVASNPAASKTAASTRKPTSAKALAELNVSLESENIALKGMSIDVYSACHTDTRLQSFLEQLAKVAEEARRLKKFKVAFVQQKQAQEEELIPRPQGDRTKPGGFRLIDEMNLTDDKPKYLEIMVSINGYFLSRRCFSLILSAQRGIRQIVDKAGLNYRLRINQQESGRLFQFYSEVSCTSNAINFYII